MSTYTVPHIAEMIDSYLTIHHDYLKTDSITAAERLKNQLNAIEKDMKDKGCKIINCTEKWQQYICNLPELKQYPFIAPDLLSKANAELNGENAALFLECLRMVENAVLNNSGKRNSEQKFYSETDIIEFIDGNTLKKNVSFSEINISEAIKNL